MSLLEEIQTAAVDSNSDIGSLLRKCKLLAARLGSQPLEDWLVRESNGYPSDVDVPPYRIWPLQIKGHFRGHYGGGMQDAFIPMSLIPEAIRKNFQKFECRQSVASIEETLNKSTLGMVSVSTGDLALFLADKVYHEQTCVKAWGEFSTGRIVELLNAVRNRILDFAITVWHEAPTAGESSSSTIPSAIEPAKVTQIFHTKVYGGYANLVGSAQNSTVTFNVQVNDFKSLEQVLRNHGVPQEDIGELQEALSSDPPPIDGGKFGPKVAAWISKMVYKAATGGWDIAIQAAGTLLAGAISKYYGLGIV